MDIGKFSCMPEVDVLPMAKRSNAENKAGDTVTGTEYVAQDTLLFDRQRKLRVLFRGFCGSPGS
jgi:hypothetical protein